MAVITSTVDAANRLTGLNARTLTYDDNGNLTGDGNQVYVWNARDQLTQIKSLTGTVLASFSYDALGRRQGKTVYGEGTGYVYDGVNIVQELNGPTLPNSVPANVRASYISGGVDEVFAQLRGTGASAKVASYLTDALGSTVRLTDGAGNKLVDYTYDPYGATTADAFVGNPFQYTGRENDGNGLYYYRARYYSPGMARFISSDPIGLGGGVNTFGYVDGDPVSNVDPSGLQASSLRAIASAPASSMRSWRRPNSLIDPYDMQLLGSSTSLSSNSNSTICTPPLSDKSGRKISPVAQSLGAPGNCTPKDQGRMQESVKNACGTSRSCKPGMMRAEMYLMRENSRECAMARDKINNVCFMGGDAGHRNAAIDAWQSVANCEGMLK